MFKKKVLGATYCNCNSIRIKRFISKKQLLKEPQVQINMHINCNLYVLQTIILQI